MLFPLEKLLDEKKPLKTISADKPLREALRLMVEYDFSQLPIVDRDGMLAGILSEQTIIRSYYHLSETSILDLTVDHFGTNPVTLKPDDDLFEAIDRLKNIYAIIVAEGKKPIGILTDYDIAHFFRDLSEGLIIVEDIETTLRHRIEAAFPTEKARQAAIVSAFGMDRKETQKPAKEYDRLTFYEHVQLITDERNWEKFKGTFEPKAVFNSWMDPVRDIRNQLTHFRGRPDALQYDALKRANYWLQRRPKLHTTQAASVQNVNITSSDAPPAQKQGAKYQYLKDWLINRGETETNIQVGFADIEVLIGEKLPDLAKQHRSWWSNDNKYKQSLAWLEAGWRVEDVDLDAGTVNFRRTVFVILQLFFSELLNQLKATKPEITRASKAPQRNWLSFSAGRKGFSFIWAFRQDSVVAGQPTDDYPEQTKSDENESSYREQFFVFHNALCVELFIDTGDEKKNKDSFDALFLQRDAIEKEIGNHLQWQRLEGKRGCRIRASKPSKITDSQEELQIAKQWALDMMVKFFKVFQGRIKRLRE